MRAPRPHDEFEQIRFDRPEPRLLVVTIDRPGNDLNAIDEAMHHELTVLLDTLETEREARCIVPTGSDRALSAGGDFGWFPDLREPGG